MNILKDYFSSSRQILFIDAAVSCEKSTEAVFELYPRVLAKEPDIVSIMIGSNGVIVGNTASPYKKDFKPGLIKATFLEFHPEFRLDKDGGYW
jgi:hypothetical protein